MCDDNDTAKDQRRNKEAPTAAGPSPVEDCFLMAARGFVSG